jgi:hypothetical protein
MGDEHLTERLGEFFKPFGSPPTMMTAYFADGFGSSNCCSIALRRGSAARDLAGAGIPKGAPAARAGPAPVLPNPRLCTGEEFLSTKKARPALCRCLKYRAGTMPRVRSHSCRVVLQQLHSITRDNSMWIKDELLSGTFIEIFVALWRLVQSDDLNVHRFGNFYFVIENRLH